MDRVIVFLTFTFVLTHLASNGHRRAALLAVGIGALVATAFAIAPTVMQAYLFN